MRLIERGVGFPGRMISPHRSGFSLIAKFFRTLSIRTRIVLLVVALVLVGIWGVAVRATVVLQDDLKKSLSDHLSTTVAYVTSDLDKQFLTRITALNEIAKLITPDVLADRGKLRRILQQRRSLTAVLHLELFVADASGTVIADNPASVERLGDSVKDREYFRESMASGESVVGSPLRGRFPHYRGIVPLAVPLRDASSAVAGVLISLVDLADPLVFGQLEQTRIGQSGGLRVMSARERMILSDSDGNRIMEALPAHGVIPLLDRRLEEGYDGPGIIAEIHGARFFSMSRRMATTGWIVCALVPTKEIFRPVARVKREMYLAALLVSLFVAVILRFVLAREFARLNAVGTAMRRMTGGTEPFAPIPVTREDEIGKMKAAFNALVAERNRVHEALHADISGHKQANEELEKTTARLQEFSDRFIRARDQERSKIAFELLEQSGQELATLKIHLQLLAEHCCDDDGKTHLEDARAVAELALDRIHGMSMNLHPRQLDDFGLHKALRSLCAQQAAAAGWIMHFDAPEPDGRADREVEMACFRVAQEALDNAARHANATEMWVSLRESANEMRLTLRDNGLGFNVAAIRDNPEHGSLGLMEMTERAKQVGGQLSIESSADHGTEIHAVLPKHIAASWPRDLEGAKA